MKNLFLLPTNKPSRLFDFMTKLILIDKISTDEGNMNRHIYITNDEEIKEKRCWVINPYNKRESVPHSRYGKLVVMTTDQELIEDGVQEIDDEFLEWFVKNPSCENVEVQKWSSLAECGYSYRIKLPQEEPKRDRTCSNNCSDVCGECQIFEPKQEPIEEREPYWELVDKKAEQNNRIDLDAYARGVIDGVEWQAKRMYSEEEAIQIVLDLRFKIELDSTREEIKEWFEQFKKK
jgi:hypothetical protein